MSPLVDSIVTLHLSRHVIIVTEGFNGLLIKLVVLVLFHGHLVGIRQHITIVILHQIQSRGRGSGRRVVRVMLVIKLVRRLIAGVMRLLARKSDLEIGGPTVTGVEPELVAQIRAID